jgi:RNA polymerase sigma factor (TIGR02999 family)
MKLVDQERTDWKDRVHFFAIAAKIMRHILVDQARFARRQKRGGGCAQVTLADNLAHPGTGELDALALDEALTKLARRDARKARVIELRYFAGLEIKEIADLLDISVETVTRDLRLARAWLERELERSPER